MPYKVLRDFTYFGKKYREGTIIEDSAFTPGQFAGFVQFGRMESVESLSKELQAHTIPELQIIAEAINLDVHGLKKDEIVQAIINTESPVVDESPQDENPGTE